MVKEDYVSFETAKLLKEKGFDGNCYKVWAKESKSEPKLYAAPNFVEGETIVNRESVEDGERFMNSLNSSEYRIEGYLAPTLQMVMKWLREVHKLSIEPYYDELLTWVVDIKHIGKHTDTREFETVRENWYKTYEEACEAAIKYCLENLI